MSKPAPLTSDELMMKLLERFEDADRKAAAAKRWASISKVASVVLVPLLLWALGLEIRVRGIEDHQFTSADAVEMRDSIMEALPPMWLREDIAEIKQMLRDYDKRLRALENGK